MIGAGLKAAMGLMGRLGATQGAGMAANAGIRGVQAAVGAGRWAATNPRSAAVLGAAAAIPMIPESDYSAAKHAHKRQNDRFYGGVETHKPHDAREAYMYDDFLKEAYSAAPDYETYEGILRDGYFGDGKLPASALSRKEFERIRKSPEYSQEYAQHRVRNDMAEFNAKNWGEDWENRVSAGEYDPTQPEWEAKMAKRRALAIQKNTRKGLKEGL